MDNFALVHTLKQSGAVISIMEEQLGSRDVKAWLNLGTGEKHSLSPFLRTI